MVDIDRFSDRARHIMQMANSEALNDKAETISAKHILMALSKSGDDPSTANIGSHLLRSTFLMDSETLRNKLNLSVCEGSKSSKRLPTIKSVLESAISSSKELGHKYVGTEHLFLGLLKQEGMIENLQKIGVNTDSIIDRVNNMLGMGDSFQDLMKSVSDVHISDTPLHDLFWPQLNFAMNHNLWQSEESFINDFDKLIELIQKTKKAYLVLKPVFKQFNKDFLKSSFDLVEKNIIFDQLSVNFMKLTKSSDEDYDEIFKETCNHIKVSWPKISSELFVKDLFALVEAAILSNKINKLNINQIETILAVIQRLQSGSVQAEHITDHIQKFVNQNIDVCGPIAGIFPLLQELIDLDKVNK